MASFELLIEISTADSLKIPKEVSLLDYAAINWKCLPRQRAGLGSDDKGATDAEGWWNTVASRVMTRICGNRGVRQSTA